MQQQQNTSTKKSYKSYFHDMADHTQANYALAQKMLKQKVAFQSK